MTKDKDVKLDIQVIIMCNKPSSALKISKDRWQVETAFRAFKNKWFNIEPSHLTDIERIEKLFVLVLN